MNLIIILLFLIIILLYHSSKNNFTENNNKEIVVSRYNEDLSWLNNKPFNNYPVIVYNKGTNDSFIKHDNIYKIVNLPNIGKIDHTILYHIINNYNNLKDITIFLPGSVNMKYKYKKAKKVIELTEKINNSVYMCNKNVNFEKLKNFKMDGYETRYSINKNKNTDDIMLKSTIRPFDKWYNNFFEDKKLTCVGFYGIFSMSKKDILKNPLSYYQNLIKQLDSHPNPETGHYFERAWEGVFYPLDPESKIYI
jgi:hypothetical protein